jgi:hypothetical protein
MCVDNGSAVVVCAPRWRHFDSAAMNERPDEPVDKEKGYRPQFGVTGQDLHYHQEAGGPQLGLCTSVVHIVVHSALGMIMQT